MRPFSAANSTHLAPYQHQQPQVDERQYKPVLRQQQLSLNVLGIQHQEGNQKSICRSLTMQLHLPSLLGLMLEYCVLLALVLLVNMYSPDAASNGVGKILDNSSAVPVAVGSVPSTYPALDCGSKSTTRTRCPK